VLVWVHAIGMSLEAHRIELGMAPALAHLVVGWQPSTGLRQQQRLRPLAHGSSLRPWQAADIQKRGHAIKDVVVLAQGAPSESEALALAELTPLALEVRQANVFASFETPGGDGAIWTRVLLATSASAAEAKASATAISWARRQRAAWP